MKTMQRGFTLIELVVVIVILGILAATALPKFLDLSANAGEAASEGVAGALASGSAINYAAKSVGATASNVLAANVCTTAILGGLVNGVTIKDTAAATSKEFQIAGTGDCTTGSVALMAGKPVTCTIQGLKGAAVNATVICSG